MTHARVLLVDDEAEFVETLKERLELRGLTVFTANDGPSAIEQIREHNIDAVILDLHMPGMDGIETLKKMRSIDDGLQIIVLTGYGAVSKSVEAVRAGARDFLEKPVGIDKLTEVIEEAADTRFTVLQERSVKAVETILKTKGW